MNEFDPNPTDRIDTAAPNRRPLAGRETRVHDDHPFGAERYSNN